MPSAPPSAEQVEAERVYVACLAKAARYADDKTSAVGSVAVQIAPMCYPQFSHLEALAGQGLGARDQRAFVRNGDQRQLDLASAAIGKERQSVALSDAR